MADETKNVVTYCLNRKRAEDILRSLHYEQISERKSEIKPAHSKTFRWSLSEEMTTLARWLRDKNDIYWIQGKAGSGKSTLMKYLLQEERTRDLLQEWAQERPLLVVNHFFWGPGTKIQCDINGLYRALLFQILMEHPELIDAVCTNRMGKDSLRHLESWTTEELHNCFTSLAKLPALPCKLCIFIDGLDEFRGDFADLISLVQVLGDSKDIKICVASRPWVQFRDVFGGSFWQLRVEDLTKEDIKNYVNDVLCADDRFTKLQESMPGQSEFFRKEIATRADGVFFWVYLVTRNLLRGLTNDDDVSTLIRRLNQFPTDLEDYFMNMLMSIDDVYHVETSAIFSMLMYSPSSRLSVDLLWAYRLSQPLVERAAIACFPANSEMLENRSLSIDGRIDLSGLVQRSAHEFLESIDNTFLPDRKGSLIGMDQERELNYVSTICKDLVNTRELDNKPPESNTVGFLHRSVADFLSLPRTSALLKRRLPSEFDVRIAICGAYLFIFRKLDLAARTRSSKDQDDQEEREKLVLLMLYLLKQVRNDSARSTSGLMIELVSAAIFRQHRDEHLRGVLPDDLVELGGSSPLQVDHFRILLAHMTGKCSGTIATAAAFGQLSQALNRMEQDCLYWAGGASNTWSCLDLLLVNEPVIILRPPSSSGVSRDLGRPELRYNTFVNTMPVLTFLQDNDSTEVDGGSSVDPWPRFLRRQARRVEARRNQVDNFLEVCRLLILHGAPRQIAGYKLLSEEAGPGFRHYDAAEIIWNIITKGSKTKSLTTEDQLESLSLEDIQAIWPRTQEGTVPLGRKEPDTGILAVARRGWKMLPWT